MITHNQHFNITSPCQQKSQREKRGEREREREKERKRERERERERERRERETFKEIFALKRLWVVRGGEVPTVVVEKLNAWFRTSVWPTRTGVPSGDNAPRWDDLPRILSHPGVLSPDASVTRECNPLGPYCRPMPTRTSS